jgi:hypothetical protein
MRAAHFQHSDATSVPHSGHRVGLAVVETPAEAQSHSGSPQIKTKSGAAAAPCGRTRFNGTPQAAQ